MKKYNFFKAICLPCIILSTISCGNEDYFIETSELQLNAMPFAEANIDTTKFEIVHSQNAGFLRLKSLFP